MKSEESKVCVVRGCRNSSDGGEFVGDFCKPCYDTATTGEGVHSTVYKNMKKVLSSPSPDLKFYFAIFEVTFTGFSIASGGTSIIQEIIDVHPIQHQINMNGFYEPEYNTSALNSTRKEQWKVLDWKEISFDEYGKYKGRV